MFLKDMCGRDVLRESHFLLSKPCNQRHVKIISGHNISQHCPVVDDESLD